MIDAETDSPPELTVTVPWPMGVFEGRIAVIWLGETKYGIACVVTAPTLTVIATPARVVWSGTPCDALDCAMLSEPAITKIDPCAIP